MNISWDTTERAFVAELTQGSEWSADQQAAKKAGFKTTGPPAWRWQTFKIDPLLKLRKDRPMSGLTISPAALEQFNILLPIHDRNEQVKSAFKTAKKEAEKLAGLTRLETTDEKWWIDKSDLPVKTVEYNKYVPPEPPELRCLGCNDPVYWYEYVSEKRCIYCEKELDNVFDL